MMVLIDTGCHHRQATLRLNSKYFHILLQVVMFLHQADLHVTAHDFVDQSEVTL